MIVLLKLWARLTGRNSKHLPKAVIVNQMLEPRPLPVGRTEFEEWSDRIISGALLPADAASQKFALADALLHLGPTESHKPDAHFIHTLRKFAVNQVAVEMRKELHDERKAALAKEEAGNENVTKIIPIGVTN